jgi:uncharacterized protein YhfF
MSDAGNRVCEFGLPGPLRDRLVAAVLNGEKTATSSLLAEWQVDDEPLPMVGERQTVVDSAGKPVGEIEVLAVDVIQLGDADSGLASEEGEGFASVDDWKSAHERFWTDEVIPRLPADLAGPLTDETEVVVERFRLVE